MFLTGRTGTFKTALAALCQQHFGAAMDASHLPANFASTANALESLAFSAKDTLLVVDDFAPTGGIGDGTLEAVAERLFRAAGNHQGRSRMSGNGRPRAPQPPRALILATGEEVPRGHSLRARLLIVPVGPGDVNREALTRCQQAAQEGQFATAMGGFLVWVAGQYEELQANRQIRARELRSQFNRGAVHARLPTTLAELQSGWEIWLRFALEVGAINTVEQAELEQRSVEGPERVSPPPSSVSPRQRSRSALCGAATNRSCQRPRPRSGPTRKGTGITRDLGLARQSTRRRWVPQGTRIGWVTGSDLFLEPSLSYQVAQHVAGIRALPLE